MDNETQRDANTMISWLALALAAFASIVSVVAFNRSGTDLDTVIENQAMRATESVQKDAQNVSDIVEDTVPDDIDVNVEVEEDTE